MALFINDTGVVPNPDGWKYYFTETNHFVITKNYSYIYPEVIKHGTANGLVIPTEQQVIDWMCANLFVGCYERESMSPLANKLYLGLPNIRPQGCCGR